VPHVLSRAAIARAGSAFIAQGVSSLANLITGLIVARSLGVAGLGTYAYCVSVMLLVVAVQSAWVGDSATVLDRRQPHIRTGLNSSQWVLAVAGASVGGVVVLATAGVGARTSLVFAFLTFTWQMEEYVRRLFMARQEFVRQGVNDAVYAVLSIGLLLLVQRVAEVDLDGVFLSMSAGACVAWLSGHLVLPKDERLRAPRLTRIGVREVADYGAWRAAQSGTGWAVQAAVRLLVIATASATALGTLEAGRLIVAPLFVMLAATANMLLPMMAAMRGRGRRLAMRAALLATAAQLAVCAIFAVLILTAGDELVPFLLDSSYDIPSSVFLGWLTVCAVMAATGPVAAAASVVVASRVVFTARVAGSVLSLATAGALLALDRPNGVPFAMAAGLLVSGVWLAVLSSQASRWDATNGR
jgi:O-antigen/teichoic acid export membrane protein